MYVAAMVELQTSHKGCGLFVFGTKAIEEWILLGPFTGTLRRTSEVEENQKEFTLEASPDGSWSLFAPKEKCVLSMINEPSENERANCSLVAFAVTDATGVAMEEGDDKYMLWVVTCEKVLKSKELTMLYNNKNYKRGYKTGDPPLRAPPNAADMYRLIKTYCEHTHVSYKELVNEYGAQEEH